MSRHSQRVWRPKYKATHVSRNDGSPAMLISKTGHLITLMNEDGAVWTNLASNWQEIDNGR